MFDTMLGTGNSMVSKNKHRPCSFVANELMMQTIAN